MGASCTENKIKKKGKTLADLSCNGVVLKNILKIEIQPEK
jgi:hypothetical protein